MKYLDEFRDSAKAGFLLKEIEGLTAALSIPDDRPLHFMEVCGGHTHSIFRYGVEGMLPRGIEFVHGPGCPVCVLPMRSRRRLRRHRRATRGYLHHLRRRDARARSRRKPAPSQGRRRRRPHGLFADGRARSWRATNPDREIVFFGLGFETTMPSTALTILQAEADGVENFSVFCNHITIVPTIKAILDSPDLRLDGFLGPGHVSMVIGTAPYEFIARYYRKPMVVAGFEPLDILQSIWMVLRQIKEGRVEIENQYARVVPEAGNAPALARCFASLRAARILRMAGLGFDRPFRRQAARRLRSLRRRAQIRGSEYEDRRPQGLPMRRSAEEASSSPSNARRSAPPARRNRRSAR